MTVGVSMGQGWRKALGRVGQAGQNRRRPYRRRPYNRRDLNEPYG